MLKKIMNNKFFKSILTLSTGTILAQVISFIFSPIMTRIYSPEDIGIYTLIITSVSMFGGIIAGRYDLAIVTEKREKNVNALIKLSLIITFSLSFIIGILYSAYYLWVGDINFSFILFFFFVFILLLFKGLELITTAYNNRTNNYSLISTGNIYQSVAREGTMALFGFLSPNPFGLTLSQIIGRNINIIKQSEGIKKRVSDIKQITKQDLLSIGKKYKDQPIFSVPALFANSFSYSSINIFVEQLYGASTLGFYSISYRILGIPLTLISSNVSKVYFREASIEQNNKGNYKRTFVRTSLLLMLVAMLMVFGLIVFSPPIFSWLFGSEWSISGKYVQILAPMYGVRLVVSSLSTGTIISRKQNYELAMQSSFIIVSIGVFLVVTYFKFPIDIYLILISVSYTIIYIIYYLILFKMSNESR